jgi:hypothetical protein
MIFARRVRWTDPNDPARWQKRTGPSGREYFAPRVSSEEYAQTSLRRNFSKMEYIGEKLLDKIDATLNKSISSKFIEEALDHAKKKISPVAAAMLKANFDKAGVGKRTAEKDYKHTGNLRRAVEGVVAYVTTKGKLGPRIVFKMPPGMPKYESGWHTGKMSDFYTVAGALQYGAVHVPIRSDPTHRDLPSGEIRTTKHQRNKRLIGTKMRATLKRHVLGQREMSGRERSALERSKTGGIAGMRFSGRNVVVSMNRGQTVTVIRPFAFFNLSAAQRQSLMALFVKTFEEELEFSLGINTHD